MGDTAPASRQCLQREQHPRLAAFLSPDIATVTSAPSLFSCAAAAALAFTVPVLQRQFQKQGRRRSRAEMKCTTCDLVHMR